MDADKAPGRCASDSIEYLYGSDWHRGGTAGRHSDYGNGDGG